MTLAILSALPEEQQGLHDELDHPQKIRHAQRDFWRGRWHGQDVVLALSGIGKVAAASTASSLIETFGVRSIVFTGVAGGMGQGVAVGDVVLARAFLQHDLDVSPLFPRYVVPMYGCQTFACQAELTALLGSAIDQARRQWPSSTVVHEGLIVSGDRFVSDRVMAHQIVADLQRAGFDPLAVEMEGAAVAQVCFDHGVDFAAVRIVSDRADDQAHQDFSSFVSTTAGPMACAMLNHFLALREARLG